MRTALPTSSIMATATTPQPVSQPAELSTLFGRPSVATGLIAAVTFIVYYGTLSFEFVWDDVYQIVNNPLIRSWHSIPRVFGSDLWFHTARGQVYYRPLFILWEILDFKIFGLKTWGWHLTTVVLHVLAACVLYRFARALKLDHWTASLAALIFGVHPIHIECAAWVSAGSESMVSIFYMLAFICYLKARDLQAGEKTRRQLAACGLLALALLSKEMAVTFALMVTLYEWLAGDAGFNKLARLRHAVIASMPYVAVTIGYLLLRTLALRRTSELDPTHTNLDVVLTWPVVLFSYAKLLIFPKGLTAVYDVPYVLRPGLGNFVLPLAALIGAAALVWYWAARKRDWQVAFFAAWIPLTLIPALHLRLFSPGGGVRDRYIYVSSIGFALLVAKALRLLPAGREIRLAYLRPAASVALPAALVAATLVQQVYWANNLLLFYRAYSLYPQSAFAALNLSEALIAKRQYGRAVPILMDVAREHPNSGKPHLYLTQAYLRLGRQEEAREELDKAVAIEPELIQSETGRSDLGNLYGQMGEYRQAIRIYDAVLEREPDLYSALYNGGYAYFLVGDDKQAEKLLSHAVQVAPDTPLPIFYLGRVCFRTGRSEQAESLFRQALRLDPTGYDFHYWYGRALAARGETAQAEAQYAEELRLHPNHVEAPAEINTGRTERRQ